MESKDPIKEFELNSQLKMLQKDFINSLGKFNEVGLESVRKLGEIQLRAVERLTEQQLALASDYFSGGVKQLEAMSEARDPRTIVADQTKAVTELNEKLVDHGRKTMEIIGDIRGELGDWAKAGFENASAAAPAPRATKASPKKAA